MRQLIAHFYVEIEKLKYTAYRAFSRILKGGSPGPEGSIMKLHWSEFHQRMQEFALELEGPASQLIRESPYAIRDGLWQYTFLWSRSDTIYAGTSEIQRNIIAQRVLGLPKYPEPPYNRCNRRRKSLGALPSSGDSCRWL